MDGIPFPRELYHLLKGYGRKTEGSFPAERIAGANATAPSAGKFSAEGTRMQTCGHVTVPPAILIYVNVHPQALQCPCGFLMRKENGMTREDKNNQIRKEARATMILFLICFLWHVGCAYLLSGNGITLFGLPLWWVLSTPGVFVVAVIGLIILLKKVFVNFSLEDEDELIGKEA